MSTITEKVDHFSFIDNLQTTVRQLSVFSAIIYHLNNRHLPKKLLEQLLTAWSTQEEAANQIYNLAKGKITNKGKKTSALGYYIQISTSFGITSRFNDVYMNTRMSQTFLYFISSKDPKMNELNLSEKVFYLFMLLENDSDGLIICLSQIANSNGKKQSLLQNEFKDAMSARLLSKMEAAPATIKTKIAAKYKSINFIWRKSKKYAEHIIAPRYEWLSNLGLVRIKRDNKNTLYFLNSSGEMFYEFLPTFSENKIKDINTAWMNKMFFAVCSSIFNGEQTRSYSELDKEHQDIEFGESLINAAKAVKSSISFKLPVKETFFFICLDFLVNKNIVIEFEDIREKLKSNFMYQSKVYQLKLASRSNEGYITIKLNR